MRALSLALLAAAGLALAGCSGDGGDDGNPAPTTSTAPADTTTSRQSTTPAANATSSTSASAAPSGPKTWEKDVQDNSFPDGTFTVRAGDTVVWTHLGSNPHSVTSDGNFDSHPACTLATAPLGQCMDGGDAFDVTLSEPGTYEYRCRIHAAMTGSVTVEA